ncbi:hypothetical protein [Paenibacillus thiaminolyticus]|uniref:hypothetical protein n=1 Tax=Paenibacillus thiaminolyticus TaxID=49283 RepID=UPI0025427430|nr:hypothetical protein [Paenibacillus thiaminolyticus]WII38941.1 hypothetical protein O0V01_07485 [Paenibacillus thiaminolyticus]
MESGMIPGIISGIMSGMMGRGIESSEMVDLKMMDRENQDKFLAVYKAHSVKLIKYIKLLK